MSKLDDVTMSLRKSMSSVYKLVEAKCGSCGETKLCMRGVDWSDEVVAERGRICGEEGNGLQCIECEIDGNFIEFLDGIRIIVPDEMDVNPRRHVLVADDKTVAELAFALDISLPVN